MQKAYKLNKDFVLTCVKDERKRLRLIPLELKESFAYSWSFLLCINSTTNSTPTP